MEPMLGLESIQGRFVHLVPMGEDHIEGLLEAANEDRSTFTYTPVPWDRETMTAYVHKALATRDSGEQYPFVTFGVDQRRIVGSTRFYDLAPWDWSSLYPGSDVHQRVGRPDVASIGYTWLSPSAQRTPINTEAKLLMMTHAFDRWDVRAVQIRTDARNDRSRAAIERLGCVLDGVIRADMPGADGTERDSAVYSMLAAEWPVHRRRLVARLAR
ncbi:MAG TPA: GNAT family protein [Acidimicrobiales bacterium]|nr:GNAT family protein [Acidimicrobiales bacterium]